MSTSIRISASRPYDVVIGNRILQDIGPAVRERFSYGSVAVITDDNVDKLYAGSVLKSLSDAGIRCCRFVFRSGEESKNIGTVTDFIGFMASHGITRSDAVLALGGGVTGDMGGFAAAVYMRGIDFIQLPTTLLAMTDSSVGGKTAVDIQEGKNLVGAFHQPSLVWCDTDTLTTLPHDTLRDGYAEIIKYGVLFSEEFFNELSFQTDIQKTVFESVTFKRNIVEADETDRGQRALLNLGHTIGHALERLSNYRMTHGEAVAIGLVRAAKLAAAYGFIDNTEAIAGKAAGFGFATTSPYSAEQICQAALSDKKRTSDGITLILPERIGRCSQVNVSIDEFRKLLRQTED